MAFPNVDIQLQNGALGAVGALPDGVAALVLTGTGTVAMPLGTPKVVFSLAEAEGLGITATSQPTAYRHIKEFYDAYRFISGSDVAELYIIMLTNTVTMASAADVNTAIGAKSLVAYSNGRVRLLGITRAPQTGYTPDLSDGVDDDTLAAIPKANDLANYFANLQAPIRVLVEGRAFEVANIGDLIDLKTMAYNRVSVVLWSTANDGSSSVGYTLGIKAALPVQRKISRVKNGQFAFTNAYIGNEKVADVTGKETIHDKGYIVLTQYPGRAGYYFGGEPMACPDSDDYALLSRGCVIDKAQRIAYNTFLDEVEEDIEVDENGQLLAGYKSYIEQKVVNNISLLMAGEISGKPLFSIPDGQNILATATTEAILKIIPKGYQTYIEVKLGFSNPAFGA